MPGLDAISFVFGQVLTQIEYLHESGHLSQENYATIVGALMQATPPATPTAMPSQQLPPIFEKPQVLSTEPGQYTTSPASSSSAVPLPPQPSRSGSSFLKLKSKSGMSSNQSGSSSSGPSSITGYTLPTGSNASRPGDGSDREEQEDLGKINKNIRRALEGGFLLGSVVDQALAVTPFVPGSFRERLVEQVEEGSGEWVRKLTSPRQQAIARENMTRAGSSVYKVARGGGGTSRASRPNLSQSNTPSASEIGSETGTFSLIASAEGQADGEAAFSITSVHSFSASESVQITAVVTASFIDTVGRSAKAREAGFAPDLVSPHEQAPPTWTQPDQSITPKDPKAVTGHVW